MNGFTLLSRNPVESGGFFFVFIFHQFDPMWLMWSRTIGIRLAWRTVQTGLLSTVPAYKRMSGQSDQAQYGNGNGHDRKKEWILASLLFRLHSIIRVQDLRQHFPVGWVVCIRRKPDPEEKKPL